jgi:Tol biopolymer transport system component
MHYLTTDWATGDISMLGISTNASRRITLKPGGSATNPAVLAVLSPDSHSIAYIRNEIDSKDGQETNVLRVMPNESGGQSRVLVDSGKYYLFPWAWSPDSTRILVTLLTKDSDSDSQIAWVRVSDGEVTVLRSLKGRIQPDEKISLSPDGRFLVYSALEQPKSRKTPLHADITASQIYILDSEGTTERPLTKSAGINSAPIWTPDGGRILFSSDRNGTFGLWSLPMRDGIAAGIPSLVKSDIGGIRAIGFDASGSFYYSHLRRGEGSDIFMVKWDLVTGKVYGPPALASENSVGTNQRPAWSLDGKYIAFHRVRLVGGVPQDYLDLIIRNLETGAEILLPFTPSGVPLWASDGTLVSGAEDAEGRRSFYRVDPKTGRFDEIRVPDFFFSRILALSRDGKTVYASVSTTQSPSQTGLHRVAAIDLATGRQTSVFTTDGFVPLFSLSPDGSTLALLVVRGSGERIQSQLALVGVDGANFRILYEPEPGILHVPDGFRPPGLAWTKDGRSILFARNRNGGWEMMRIAAAGGVPESTGLTGRLMHVIDLSPDGTAIVYGDGGSPNSYETLALDNVISSSKR